MLEAVEVRPDVLAHDVVASADRPVRRIGILLILVRLLADGLFLVALLHQQTRAVVIRQVSNHRESLLVWVCDALSLDRLIANQVFGLLAVGAGAIVGKCATRILMILGHLNNFSKFKF